MSRRRRRTLGRTIGRASRALPTAAATLGRAAAIAAANAGLAGLAVVALPVVAASPSVAFAQAADASDQLRLGGDRASSWQEGETRVVMIDGNVSIRTDDATLTADRAVLWLTPTDANDRSGVDAPADADSGGYRVQIALLGNARAVRGDLTRTGGELFVTLATRPDVQLDVADLSDADRRTDVHYLAGAQLRRQAERGEGDRPLDVSPPVAATLQPSDGSAPAAPTTVPAANRKPRQPSTITFEWDRAQNEMTPDGRVAIVVSGDVLIVQQQSDGSRVELRAQNAVLFTRWTEPRQMLEGGLNAAEDFDSVYLEDDVRVARTGADPIEPEQTLRASRVVYEFSTNRAILTDALLHSIDPNAAAPIVVRAREMRLLGNNVIEARNAQITTSDFRTPSLALSASKVTVRQSETADGRNRTGFVAYNVTPRLYGVPFFYFPTLFGSVTDGEIPIRELTLSQSGGFGFGIGTSWGLFQTFGREPPEGVDASYRIDYYTERGPALGLDTTYAGGSINETTRQPFSFEGGFTAYGVLDSGQDKLGRRRSKPQFDDDFRGRVRWNHQQFLTDGWQLQAQAAYVSDATFLEEWFRNEFRNGLEQDTSLYVKRTSGNEIFGVLLSANLSDVATIADQLQELAPTSDGTSLAPVTVERLPQVEYHRLGESFGEDRFTWTSNNSVAGLRFNRSDTELFGGNGYGFANSGATAVDDAYTGIPTYAYTGYTGDIVGRGDFRQEVAMPMGDDRIRVTPYTVLRYTAWSDSPGGDAQQRLLGGVGVRTSTQFHKTYDGVRSELFDLNRLRHIVEPQASLFASAQTQDRNDVYVYDEGVDGISDVVGAQLAVRQRFQTKRGGDGLFRSVDFLTLNTGVLLFTNQEDEIESLDDGDYETASGFRGVWYGNSPEASIPRSTVYSDAAWRVTDTTAILGDVSWNIDEQNLATTALGLAVQRDPRVRYFAGVRYIGEINSTLATVTFDYDISERYSIALNQSFNLSEGQNQSTSAELTRRFEQLVFRVTVYFDQIEDEGGIQFSISPRNLPFGMNLQGRNTGRS